MVVEQKAMKRRRKNNRLSSLHDDLLIVIISCLPLQSAVVTGLLSRRWRGLWINLSSIIMSNPKFDYRFVFSDVFLNVIMQIKSPFVNNLHLEFKGDTPDRNWEPPGYSWLRRICDLNILELKLTWPNTSRKFVLPDFIFQTQSLVSIELDSTFHCELTIVADSIILPNLKNLSLHFYYFNCESLGTLIKSCPSLEELSLKCKDEWSNGYLICSNQNLRRLLMYWRSGTRSKLVINAPKLEYLDVCAPITGVICLDEEPIALREAKLQISENNHLLDGEEKKLKSKFYKAISCVEWITLDVADLGRISTVFHNVTKLTLNMKMYIDSNVILPLLKLCPVLDVFALKLENDYTRQEPRVKRPSHSRCSSTLRRVLKRVEVEIDWCEFSYRSKSFVELVGFLLLTKTIKSKHFHFRLRGMRYCRKDTEERIKRMEIDLCKIFHQAPMVSKGREVEFVGEFYKHSRNACRKFSRPNPEIIYFSCSQPRIED